MKRSISLLALMGALMSGAPAQYILEPISIGSVDPSQYSSYSDFFPASGPRTRLDIDNIPSWDPRDDPDNIRLTLNLGGSPLNGVYWDVTLETVLPTSVLNDFALLFVNVNGAGFILRPGYTDPFPGRRTYSGGVKLRDAGFQDLVLPDNNLYLQFYEIWDDALNRIDGYWRSGFIEFQIVPEPASMVALSTGLAGLVGLRRRKK